MIRNIEDSLKELYVHHFYSFYREIVNIKDRTDYSQKDNMIVLQTQLLELIEQFTLTFKPYEGVVEEGNDDEIMYLLTAFTDEMFINIPWEGKYIWEDNLLEEQIFASHVAGNKVFAMLDRHLQIPTTSFEGLSLIYLSMLCLGFKGCFMHMDTKKQLGNYKRQLFVYLYNCHPFILKELKLLFPDAYSHPLSFGTRVKFYDVRSWIITGLLSIVSIFLILYCYSNPNEAYIAIQNTKYFLYSNRIEILIILTIIILLFFAFYFWITIKRKRLFLLARKKVTKFEIKESLRLLEKSMMEEFPSKEQRENIPIYLTIGYEKAGTSVLIKNSKLNKLANCPFEETGIIKSACNWWIYDKAVFIDPSSKLDEEIVNPVFWRYLVRRLKKIRRLRSLDGIILTIPFNDLIVSENAPINNLSRIKITTDLMYSRMLYLQKKLRMHLPVYIIVTKCDKIAGFEDFIKKVPNEYDQNMFGWSNPYNSHVITYNRDWILEAFKNINSRLTFMLFGLCIDDANETEFKKIFMLRNEIEGLKYPIQIVTNKLMSIGQNPFLASLMLRGIYFTGAKSSHAEDIESGERAFFDDLIQKKVLLENGVAKPMRKIIIY